MNLHQKTKIFNNFIHNKYSLGIILLLVTVGAKFFSIDLLTPSQEEFFKLWYVRCFIFFCIVFSATKDFGLSLFLIIFFYVIFNTVLHEDSKICILPKEAIVETKTPSEPEYNKCKKIIKEYENQLVI